MNSGSGSDRAAEGTPGKREAKDGRVHARALPCPRPDKFGARRYLTIDRHLWSKLNPPIDQRKAAKVLAAAFPKK